MELLYLARSPDAVVDGVADALVAAGYALRTVTRAAEAEHLVRAGAAEALVADAELLEDDVLLRLRRDCPAQPIVAWLDRRRTARAAELLESGVSEVLDSAMGAREISARLAAVFRTPEHAAFSVGPLEIDPDTGEAYWDGAELRLTPRERQVLQVLAAAAGRTVRRDRLYRQVWGYAMARGDRSVDVNVKRLRAKLAASTEGELEIRTQPGVGYRLELREPEVAAEPAAAVTSL